MGELQAIARRVGADERTLRRAVEQGTVRLGRPSPRRLHASLEEERYLVRYWPLIAALRRALRTERSARLAVLFGSAATGDERSSSDIDLLVDGRGLDPLERAGLSVRLAGAVGRRVHLALLNDALELPWLLADALAEGRVLVDRDRRWPDLKRREGEVRREAQRADDRTAKRAAEAVAEARARLA